MSESNGNGHSASISPLNTASRLASQLTRKGIRDTLKEAVEIKAIVFETLRRLREPFGSEEEADRARAHAQSVTSLSKAYKETTEVIRVALGKPTPGSRRPLPEQPKVKKKNLPKVQLAEAGEVQERPTTCGSQPLPVAASPSPPTTTDSPDIPQAGK